MVVIAGVLTGGTIASGNPGIGDPAHVPERSLQHDGPRAGTGISIVEIG